jgi:hypothetical protein
MNEDDVSKQLGSLRRMRGEVNNPPMARTIHEFATVHKVTWKTREFGPKILANQKPLQTVRMISPRFSHD